MLPERLTIILSGMLAAVPGQGGAAWAVLQYVLGLKRLGHRVFFVEPVAPAQLLPAGAALAESGNAAYFRQVTAAFGLADESALLLAGTTQTVGLPYAALRRAARGADLLLNLAGSLADEALFGPIPVRAYLDLDPGFTQLWHTADGVDMRFDAHTHFVTVGLALGQPGCPVPTCGRAWIPTLQPVVLAHWPVAREVRYPALTTVANWRSYGSIEYAGVFYGQKAHALRPWIDLPTRTREPFMLALAIYPGDDADRAALEANGWRLLDPRPLTATPEAYRCFVQGSKAEFGLAKSGYLAARCGWFSDRSVCYLASGRPVLAQDTGIAAYLPTGEGLFACAACDDVLAAIDALNAAYDRHARAARAIAEAHFDSDRVLPSLLERLGGRA